jgi:hypothetical protein
VRFNIAFLSLSLFVILAIEGPLFAYHEVLCPGQWVNPSWWQTVTVLKVLKNKGKIKDLDTCKDLAKDVSAFAGLIASENLLVAAAVTVGGEVHGICACNRVFDVDRQDPRGAPVMIVNAGQDLNSKGTVMAGNRGNGEVRLYLGPVPGNGHVWQIHDLGNGRVSIEDLGDPGNPTLAAQHRFLAGNRANGEVRLYPGPVPGDGHIWRINNVGNGQVTIENLGDPGNPTLAAQHRFLAGNQGDGKVSLYPGPVPGNGNLWRSE